MNQNDSSVRWQSLTSRYASPDIGRSIWQVVNTVIPFVGMWVLMYYSLRVGYWLTLLLAFPTAGLMVRIFILFHDCCHASFFKSSGANEITGFMLGLLVLTPFYQWKHDHAIHHATCADLDRRGVGDIMTLTVAEYVNLPWFKRLGYRILRNPWFLFPLGSTLNFLILHRLYSPSAGKREQESVLWTNAVLTGLVIILMKLIGWQAIVMVELPVLMIASSLGVWLFYVQHNFEGTYWARHSQWDFFKAGLIGSSYYKLPAVINWFTGDIGYHHIHHLGPRIPNYKLAQAYRENILFQIPPLSVVRSFKSLGYRLWDEDNKVMAGFGILRSYHAKVM